MLNTGGRPRAAERLAGLLADCVDCWLAPPSQHKLAQACARAHTHAHNHASPSPPSPLNPPRPPPDMWLLWDKAFRKFVDLYAKDQDKFFEDYAAVRCIYSFVACVCGGGGGYSLCNPRATPLVLKKRTRTCFSRIMLW